MNIVVREKSGHFWTVEVEDFENSDMIESLNQAMDDSPKILMFELVPEGILLVNLDNIATLSALPKKED